MLCCHLLSENEASVARRYSSTPQFLICSVFVLVPLSQCFSTFSVKCNPLQQFWLLTEPMSFLGDFWGPKGRNSRPKAVSGGGVLREGLFGRSSNPLPHQLGGLGSAVSSPSGRVSTTPGNLREFKWSSWKFLCKMWRSTAVVSSHKNMDKYSSQKYEIYRRQMFSFKFQMHQNPFSAGAPPQAPVGSLWRSPRFLFG